MTILEVVIYLIAGAICAAIAGSLLGVRTGFLGSVVIGWTIAGSFLLLLAVGLLRRGVRR